MDSDPNDSCESDVDRVRQCHADMLENVADPYPSLETTIEPEFVFSIQ